MSIVICKCGKTIDTDFDSEHFTDEDMTTCEETIPAIPPEDYKGSQADWMVALVSRGLWDDSDGSWHGDVELPASVWWEILEECES